MYYLYHGRELPVKFVGIGVPAAYVDVGGAGSNRNSYSSRMKVREGVCRARASIQIAIYMPKRSGDRGGGGGGGGDGGGGGKKARYVQGWGPGRHELAPGMRGCLITCDVHVEKDAIRETFRLLESLCEEGEGAARAGSSAPAASASTSAATAGDALAQELAELKRAEDKKPSEAGARRFTVAQTGCNGSIFIRFTDPADDPVALVDRVMEGAARCAAPHVIRMLPVQTTCPARTPEAIAEVAAPLTRPALGGDFSGTYAVHWRRRCNSDVDKVKVIDVLADAVQAAAPRATVDLKAAQAAIVAEVIKTTCCVSVLPRWREFCEYNLRVLAAGNGSAADAAVAGAANPAGQGKAAGQAGGGSAGDTAAAR